MLQQAFWLVKKEIKTQWGAIVLTVGATTLIAFFTSLLLDHSVRHYFGTNETFDRHMFLDVIFLVLSPSFGAIFMARPYLTFQTIKEDPFSKRMAFLRSLPIPIATLSLSRMLLMLVILFIMSLTFFITITIALPTEFFELLTVREYFIFILFWFGYALMMAGMNPYIEFGTNGKVLHIVPWILVVVFLSIFLCFYVVVGQGVVETMLILVKNYGWPVALISIMIGVCATFIWNQLLTMRLRRRDYL